MTNEANKSSLRVDLPRKIEIVDKSHCLFGEKIDAKAIYATPWRGDNTAELLFGLLINPHTRLDASSYLRGYYIEAIRPDDPKKPIPESYREFVQILATSQVKEI